jgi:hypothetical protein
MNDIIKFDDILRNFYYWEDEVLHDYYDALSFIQVFWK